MKKVAILTNYRDTYLISDTLKLAFIELTRVFRDHGLDLKRVSIHSFDAENKRFLDYVDLDSGGEFKIFYEPFTPDIIWNRSEDNFLYSSALLGDIFPIFPSLKLISIASDKYETSLFLKKYQPHTLLLKDFLRSELPRENLSDRVVLKPIRSSSGKWITFPQKVELLKSKLDYVGLEWLYIVQEFKDFSRGIPWLVNWIHDVRLVYIGWFFSHSTIRTPAKWSMKSNVGSGGSESFLAKERVPRELFVLAEDVLRLLDIGTNNILSIDFWYVEDEKKWYVFEINHTPGVFFWDMGSELHQWFLETFFSDIANYFLKQ